MNVNPYYLLGVLIGTVGAWFLDYLLHAPEEEAFDWRKALPSLKAAVVGAAGGTVALTLDPAASTHGLHLAFAGILTGAVSHWAGSTATRGIQEEE